MDIVVSYCTKDELAGGFGVCVFTDNKNKVDCAEGVDWKHHATEKGSWKGKTAGGSSEELHKTNPSYQLTVGKKEDKEDIEVLIVLQQDQKDISNIFAEGGHRIVPTKFYVGFYLYDEDAENEVTKTPHWLNSFDVYMFTPLKAGKTYTIFPSTRKEGEHMDFELHAFSDKLVNLKKL